MVTHKTTWKSLFYSIFWETKKQLKPTFKLSLNLSAKNVLRLKQKRHYFLILIYVLILSIELWRRSTLEIIQFFLDNLKLTWKCVEIVYFQHLTTRAFIQHKRAFLGESPEPKLRPSSRNENSENENKISDRQISKTVLIDLNIHRGETLNTK